VHLKITARFVAAVVTAAVAPLLVYGVVSIYSLRTGNETSVAEGNLNVARRAAQQIEQYMDSNVKVLQAVAADLRHTELQRWQQDRIVKNYVLDFREFRELTLFAPDGTTVASSRIGPTSLRVAIDADRDTRTIAPITIDDDFLPTTTITIPLSRLGQRDGWLVGEVSLEELWRMVDGIRVGAEGFALLVARDGRLLAHGRPDEKARVAAGENLRDHQLVSAMNDLVDPVAPTAPAGPRTAVGGARTLHLQYAAPDGRVLLGVAAPIASLGWTVMVEQPTSEAFALAEQLQQELMIIIALALVATITLGYYWGQSFIKPILVLKRGTEAIAAGRLSDRVAIAGHDEFHQLGEAFNGMADKLIELKENVRKQERQAMFGRIAAGLVHDISHPIQNIANSCRLILKLREDAEYRETFQRTVDREFSSIKRVLDDLRNLARPMPLEHFPVDVNRAIQDTVESMASLAETGGLTLESDLSPHPLFVEGDLFALGRVYRNLIVNAIEATSPGGSITVTTADLDTRARITVSDTGLGISPERLGSIFEDFNTTKRRGLGLGLAISRKIVEQLGGTITVTSRVGEGTTFVIEFDKTESRPFPKAVAAS
jgi:signal transduction histidine kinase